MGKALEIEGLNLDINGQTILSAVSMALEGGSFAAMCGRNGAGKSQLMRCIKGLRKPSGGRILLNGTEADETARMKRIALVFQSAETQVVSQSVEKDIAFGPENMGLDKAEVERRVEAALTLMGLKEKARQRPQTLSGGELRKCAIAGIIAMEPEVILLDEPFANLDYPSTLTVIRALCALHERGYTLLVVSHEAEKFLFHTDTLLIMDGGSVMEAGSSPELFPKLRDYDVYIPSGAAFGDLTWLRR